MGLFDDLGAKGASYRITEEALYAEALREAGSGLRRDGLWAKALAESDMDEGKAKAKYLKLRVQSMKDEATLLLEQIRREERTSKTVSAQPKLEPPKVAKPAEPIQRMSQEDWNRARKHGWRRLILTTGAISIAAALMFQSGWKPEGGIGEVIFLAILIAVVVVPIWFVMLLIDLVRSPPNKG